MEVVIERPSLATGISPTSFTWVLNLQVYETSEEILWGFVGYFVKKIEMFLKVTTRGTSVYVSETL